LTIRAIWLGWAAKRVPARALRRIASAHMAIMACKTFCKSWSPMRVAHCARASVSGFRLRKMPQRIRDELLLVHSPEYWEVIDRGVNFDYLPPERKQKLQQFFGWFADLA
jgi:hypothetical protein